MIRINDLQFCYEENKPLFSNFSIEIPDAARLHIAGDSGTGKTTLLRLIMGLEKPSSGIIENTAKRIAPVFQEDRLVEEWTAERNIRFGSKNVDYGIIEAMHMEHLFKKKIRELSGGEKRRVALCRALNYKPDLLILDEPFNGVDMTNMKYCIETIKQFAGSASLLVVTHHFEEADDLNCKRVYLES